MAQRNRPTILIIALSILGLMLIPGTSWSGDDGPGFDCANPHTSAESAICGDAHLAKIYRHNREAYERLKDDPVAFDIMLGSLRARQACIRWKVGEPYKACIMLVEQVAAAAYARLELKRSRENIGLRYMPYEPRLHTTGLWIWTN